MLIFERKYPVNVFDTDITGKLSPGALFNYFQDLAGRHASHLGFGYTGERVKFRIFITFRAC